MLLSKLTPVMSNKFVNLGYLHFFVYVPIYSLLSYPGGFKLKVISFLLDVVFGSGLILLLPKFVFIIVNIVVMLFCIANFYTNTKIIYKFVFNSQDTTETKEKRRPQVI